MRPTRARSSAARGEGAGDSDLVIPPIDVGEIAGEPELPGAGDGGADGGGVSECGAGSAIGAGEEGGALDVLELWPVGALFIGVVDVGPRALGRLGGQGALGGGDIFVGQPFGGEAGAKDFEIAAERGDGERNKGREEKQRLDQEAGKVARHGVSR